MTVYTVWLVNRAGGLIYQRTIVEGLHPKLSSNDYLVVASTFQSVHAISARVSPNGGGGFQLIEWQAEQPFNVHCMHTPTGLKILMTASPGHPNAEGLLRKIYECYADYALKNPFYTPEMPVRCELFDTNLLLVVK